MLNPFGTITRQDFLDYQFFALVAVANNVKKMCNSLRTRKSFSAEIIRYKSAIYAKSGKVKFVYFYVLDPQSVIDGQPKLKRIRTKFNCFATAKERDAAALRYRDEVNRKLAEGWNPLIEDSTHKSWTSFSDVLEQYCKYLLKSKKDGVMKDKTYVDYTSRLKMLTSYECSHRLHYAYQYDKNWCEQFLDYIYLDRDTSPRTRNNYLGWLCSLGTWMCDRGFIGSNPCTTIKSLPNGDKHRKVVDKDAFSKIEAYLKENDPDFLFAVQFAYYTLIRPNELVKIRIIDINISEQTVFVSSTISKNRHDGKVTLPKVLLLQMVERGTFNSPGQYYLFGSKFVPSEKMAQGRIFRERWSKMRTALNLPDCYQFYSLKDTGITDMINNVGLNVAKDQARHSSVAVTNHYAGKNQLKAQPELLNYEMKK